MNNKHICIYKNGKILIYGRPSWTPDFPLALTNISKESYVCPKNKKYFMYTDVHTKTYFVYKKIYIYIYNFPALNPKSGRPQQLQICKGCQRRCLHVNIACKQSGNKSNPDPSTKRGRLSPRNRPPFLKDPKP